MKKIISLVMALCMTLSLAVMGIPLHAAEEESELLAEGNTLVSHSTETEKDLVSIENVFLAEDPQNAPDYSLKPDADAPLNLLYQEPAITNASNSSMGTLTYTPTASYKASQFYQNAINVVLTGDYAVDLLQLIFSQQYYAEGDYDGDYGGMSGGSKNWTEYGHWYGTQVVTNKDLFNAAWCAMFISWCARQALIPEDIIHNGTYATPDNRSFNISYHSNDTPKFGDLVFFCWKGDDSTWDHVEVIYKVTNNYIYSMSGNHDNSVCFRQTSRSSSTIRAYGTYNHGSFDSSTVVKDTSILSSGATKTNVPISVSNAWDISTVMSKLNSFLSMEYKIYDAAGKWLYTYSCLDHYYIDPSGNTYTSVSEKMTDGSFIELCDTNGDVYVTLPVGVSSAPTYDFSISTPSNGETYPLEQMKATWTTVSDADHYTYSLRDLDTNTAIFENVSTNKKYAYIDASDFEAGHTYRFAVMAKDSYENTLVWAKVEFSIEKTATTYEISITTPVDGEVYPLDRLKARWTDVEDCDYFTYSLRDTTTNTLIIENQRVGRLYAYIEVENFEAGHTYKFAVMARESSGDVLAWAQSEFSISDSIPVTGVELDVTSYSLKAGQTYRLKVTVLPTTASNQDVTFKSSNTSIATVSTSGKVTAKSAGTVNITVTTDDGGYKAKCVFTITEENRPVTGISLDITSYSLEVGDTFSLTETVLPENATNQKVIWSSSNPSVAVVSSIGNVTAMSVGTTTITATTEDGGYTADCIVTVTNKTPIHGDVNGDGRIDYYDVTALYAAYVSDSFDLDTMDINKDGIVDYYDIARLYAYYCGYIFDL